DVDRQEEQHRRRDEEPGDGAISQAVHPARDGFGRGPGGAFDEVERGGVVAHWRFSPRAAPRSRGGPERRRGSLRWKDLLHVFPSSLKPFSQSTTRLSSASFAVPFPATT